MIHVGRQYQDSAYYGSSATDHHTDAAGWALGFGPDWAENYSSALVVVIDGCSCRRPREMYDGPVYCEGRHFHLVVALVGDRDHSNVMIVKAEESCSGRMYRA
jgi:hypothetical protein